MKGKDTTTPKRSRKRKEESPGKRKKSIYINEECPSQGKKIKEKH
jgi:hypothetical protein